MRERISRITKKLNDPTIASDSTTNTSAIICPRASLASAARICSAARSLLYFLCASIASPRVRISVRPRVITAAVTECPSPSPSVIPEATAMTFLTHPPSSAPTTSSWT